MVGVSFQPLRPVLSSSDGARFLVNAGLHFIPCLGALDFSSLLEYASLSLNIQLTDSSPSTVILNSSSFDFIVIDVSGTVDFYTDTDKSKFLESTYSNQCFFFTATAMDASQTVRRFLPSIFYRLLPYVNSSGSIELNCGLVIPQVLSSTSVDLSLSVESEFFGVGSKFGRVVSPTSFTFDLSVGVFQ